MYTGKALLSWLHGSGLAVYVGGNVVQLQLKPSQVTTSSQDCSDAAWCYWASCSISNLLTLWCTLLLVSYGSANCITTVDILHQPGNISMACPKADILTFLSSTMRVNYYNNHDVIEIPLCQVKHETGPNVITYFCR